MVVEASPLFAVDLARAYFWVDVGGAVAQLVGRETPDEEVPGSIPAVAARSLLVGSVSV